MYTGKEAPLWITATIRCGNIACLPEQEALLKKRIVIEVAPEIHQQIKLAAFGRSMTMSKLMLQAVLYYLEKFHR